MGSPVFSPAVRFAGIQPEPNLICVVLMLWCSVPFFFERSKKILHVFLDLLLIRKNTKCSAFERIATFADFSFSNALAWAADFARSIASNSDRSSSDRGADVQHCEDWRKMQEQAPGSSCTSAHP
jgi:hypothetical protein